MLRHQSYYKTTLMVVVDERHDRELISNPLLRLYLKEKSKRIIIFERKNNTKRNKKRKKDIVKSVSRKKKIKNKKDNTYLMTSQKIVNRNIKLLGPLNKFFYTYHPHHRHRPNRLPNHQYPCILQYHFLKFSLK